MPFLLAVAHVMVEFVLMLTFEMFLNFLIQASRATGLALTPQLIMVETSDLSRSTNVHGHPYGHHR